MAKKPTAARAAAPATSDTVVATGDGTDLVLRKTVTDTDTKPQKAGEAGPPSSLETGVGSPTGASAGGDHNYEGRRITADREKGAMDYDVQVHDDENGVQVKRVSAKSGDEAAQKVLAGHGYKGASIRGVTPASDPDPNSLGGERDASIMLHNAENPGGGANVWPGTEANAKAVKELGKADIEELGE